MNLAPIIISSLAALAGVWMGQVIGRRTAQRQWLLDQKLSVYRQALQAINEYSVWLSDVAEHAMFSTATNATADTLSKKNNQIAENFHAAYAIAPLFLSNESVELLEKVRPVLSFHSDPNSSYDPIKVNMHSSQLDAARSKLAITAKADLGSGTYRFGK